MRITLVANDTHGGVRPYLALGARLLSRGHAVRVASSENNRRAAESLGLDFAANAPDQEAVLRGEFAGLAEKGFLEVQRVMRAKAGEMVRASLRDTLPACDGADLIVAGFGGMIAAESVAEKLRVPLVQAHLQPLTPTAAYPGVLGFGVLPPFGGLGNRLSHFVSGQAFWQALSVGLDAARRELLGLGPLPRLGNVGLVRGATKLVLHGYSRFLLPPPRDWPAGVHVTGYWFLDESPDWSPSKALSEFLDRCKPPIAVGFGSMSSADAEATTRLVLEACRLAGRRVVLLSGWGGMSADSLPEWAYAVPSVPHSWLFPRVAASVHHGGAGTTGAALRAGVPSVVVPFAADQPYWAWLVSSKRLGVSAGPRKRLTPRKLADAILRATLDDVVVRTAAKMGRDITTEDGVGAACDLIESACRA